VEKVPATIQFFRQIN